MGQKYIKYVIVPKKAIKAKKNFPIPKNPKMGFPGKNYKKELS